MRPHKMRATAMPVISDNAHARNEAHVHTPHSYTCTVPMACTHALPPPRDSHAHKPRALASAGVRARRPTPCRPRPGWRLRVAPPAAPAALPRAPPPTRPRCRRAAGAAPKAPCSEACAARHVRGHNGCVWKPCTVRRPCTDEADRPPEMRASEERAACVPQQGPFQAFGVGRGDAEGRSKSATASPKAFLRLLEGGNSSYQQP
eukprot:82197-Chlamydomonas_euryale.AAC.1